MNGRKNRRTPAQGKYKNIKVMTYSTTTEVLGYFGQFRVKVRQKARSVSMEKCIGCGVCYESCPVEIPNEFNEGMGNRKAIYVPYAGSLPNVPVIDRNNVFKVFWAGVFSMQGHLPI